MAVFVIRRIEISWKINLDQTAGILKNNSDCKDIKKKVFGTNLANPEKSSRNSPRGIF